MKKLALWSILLLLSVGLTTPGQAQLAKQKDLSMEDIQVEINRLAEAGDDASKEQMAKEAAAFAKTNNEQYRMLAASIYRFLGDTDEAQKVNDGILKKFPRGIKARNDEMGAIFSNKESTALEKHAAYEAWLKKFPSDRFADDQQTAYTQAASSLGRELINEGHTDKLQALIAGAPAAEGVNYSLISTLSSALISKEQYKEALPLLEPAFAQAKNEEEKLAIHRNIISQYANSLISGGQPEKGLQIIEELMAESPAAGASAANIIALSKGYAQMGRTFDAFHSLENYLLTRAVNSQMFGEMEKLYQELNNGHGDFASYKEDLDERILKGLKERHKASMVKNEAPSFSLRNMKGELVSLEDMRGKIVVLDFWATWCGPCIVSFPGMQMAVNKYENDPDVEFLFIDTWQSEENYVELVTNFIAENQYTFHVLYDEMKERDKATVTAYGVRGIPTKVFIDKDGFIRFQSAGGSADNENVLTEVVAKIELIRELQGE